MTTLSKCDCTPVSTVLLYILTAAVAGFVALIVFNKRFRKSMIQRGMRSLRSVPGAAGIVQKEKEKYLNMMQEKLSRHPPRDPLTVTIPKKGRSFEAVLKEMEERKEHDCNWRGGRVFGVVYHGDEEFCDFLNRAYSLYSVSNPLHTSAFPSIQMMEAEVVRMTANMLHGDAKVFGTTTSGGTESLLLAVKTYRDWARATKGITEPEMVIPSTIHAAFWKAAEYFCIKPVVIDVDDTSKRADVAAMARAITSNTIMVAGSAPCYPFGVVDDIQALAALAKRHGIGMHVDNCLGGFVLSHAADAGYEFPTFDFRVDGVTSMSADLHKYGFSSKGVSCILYRSQDLAMHQFFSYPDWHGGIYASPTMAGSRPGGVIATAWASFQALGQDGYRDIASKIMQASKTMRDGANSIEGLYVPGDQLTVAFAIASSDPSLDIFMVGEALGDKGWYLERQQYPNSLHITVTFRHVGHADVFVKELRESVEAVRAHPEKYQAGMAPIYGMAAKMPDRELVGELAEYMLANMYRV